VVIGDGGDFVSYAGRLLDTYEPGCFLDPGPYGCLGTGAGYALAARLAHPDRQVVLLLGDGAAGFSLMDIDTVVIVGNNSGWGLEKSAMQQWFGYHVAAELLPTRYDEVVRALGGHGELVSESADIGPAIDRALAAGVPALVNVLTDPEDVYPRRTVLG
jgi:acetolactate synthase-1/2/3 large subunit